MCIRDSINAEYGERLEVMVLLAPRAGVVEESEAEQIEITEQRVLTRLNTQLYYAQADLMNLNKQRKEQRRHIQAIEDRVCVQVCRLNDAALVRMQQAVFAAQQAVISCSGSDSQLQAAHRKAALDAERAFRGKKAQAVEYRERHHEVLDNCPDAAPLAIGFNAVRAGSPTSAAGENDISGGTLERGILAEECHQLRQELAEERSAGKLGRSLLEKELETVRGQLSREISARAAAEAECRKLAQRVKQLEREAVAWRDDREEEGVDDSWLQDVIKDVEAGRSSSQLEPEAACVPHPGRETVRGPPVGGPPAKHRLRAKSEDRLEPGFLGPPEIGEHPLKGGGLMAVEPPAPVDQL
eukprot:TRINITY_DN49314_c0_g1_i1.p1 TRINITY_DN49314_c0_g1~~TRINITY_DN49314_c0_g1_i1.p1  ORF type:complete len:355 (-),score=80.00 TRINITY_DN49314_c0_g1_i1:66-1130(-)